MTSDPRHVRSALALREAVFAVARTAPIETATVAQVAREAGISRATFYNHADSPRQLLVRHLTLELDVVRSGFLDGAERMPLRDAWAESEDHLLEHVQRHDVIYRIDLLADEPGSGRVLGRMLADHIEGSLEEFARLDDTAEGESGTLPRRMAAAFVAHGSVGAIARWLESPAPRDPAVARTALMSSIPEWWLGRR